MKKSRTYGLMENIGLLKMIKIMRFTIFILFLSLSQSFAVDSYSQQTKLSLDFKNAKVEEVLDKIEKSSEFFFMYNKGMVDVERKIDIQVEGKGINQILDKIFENTGISYSIKDRQILLINNSMLNNGAENLSQQQKSVSGKVTDTSGTSLPGVSVVVKGTTNGTTTDANGNYSFANIPENATLQFSFVGMKGQEVLVGKKQIIDIVLEQETIGLNEIVAIGYGTQKKATLTGSIATAKGDDLQKMPTINLVSTLAGRMSGVVVNTRSSMPGAEIVQINIRGKSSWQGGSPLIIIDGIANRSGFERLNPSEIESISILKDASAAIYGSRAANGVILVTTKRGKDGKPVIDYNGDFGMTQPTRVPELARSWQFATYFTEAKRNGYMWSNEEIEKFKQGADPNLFPNYSITDQLLQSVAPQTTHTVSLRGGNEAVKYFASGRYLYQDSYFKNGMDDFNGYSIRSNIDAKVSKNFTLSLDLSGRRDDVRRAVGSSGNFGNMDVGFFEHMVWMDPTKPLYYVNGLPGAQYGWNVAEAIKGKGGEKDNLTTTINSQATARWELPFIQKGLYLEGTAAYDYANNSVKEFSKSYDLYSFSNATGEYSNLNTTPVMSRNLSDYFYNSFRYTLNGKLGYTRTLGDHNVNAFIAYEQYSINTEWISATRSTFLSDQIPYLFAGDANTQKNDGSGSEYAYRNAFSRLAYSFKEKYMFDFTLRRDESLKFPINKRVGWFPGISAGWRISEESFVKKQFKNIDNLKLRASYGQMGSDNVGDYQYLATAALRSTFDSYVLGTTPSVTSTLGFTGTPNPNISWEVANSYNIALEGSFWNGLLGFEAEYYYSKRSNILAARNASVPSYTGMTLPYENIGKAQNQGFELMLTHHNKIGSLIYNVSGNISHATNKIIYMDESANVPDYQRREGHPIDSWLVYLTDGIFNTQAEFEATEVKRAGAQLGDIKYLDVNDDKVIDDRDKVRIFDSSLPEIIFGMNFDFQYKAFEMSMLWQGQAKAKTYICPATYNGDVNIPMWMYENRWTPENAENATMPRAFYHRSESYNTIVSDFWLKDASFIRLKNVEIAYNLPESLIKKASISNAKIYVSGSNLLLIDKIKDYDPEVVNDLGVFYPATRVYNLGVKLTF